MMGVSLGRDTWTQALAEGLTAGKWRQYAALAAAKWLMSARYSFTNKAFDSASPISATSAKNSIVLVPVV